jgi:hypothetical protein
MFNPRDPGLADLAPWYAAAMASGVASGPSTVEAIDPSLRWRCCPKAVRSALDYFCTCACVTECPDHGERHHGTHD